MAENAFRLRLNAKTYLWEEFCKDSYYQIVSVKDLRSVFIAGR